MESQVQDSVCRIFADKGLYCCQEIDEYWIVDWQKKQVEVCQHKITVNYPILDSVTLLGEFLEKNGKETPLCSII